jgi:hypothetical protein
MGKYGSSFQVLQGRKLCFVFWMVEDSWYQRGFIVPISILLGSIVAKDQLCCSITQKNKIITVNNEY